MPRAGLTRARVASVAADVADEVGLERLTLAAVAQRLGVSGPALYKHVAGLDALQRDVAVLKGYGIREEDMVDALRIMRASLHGFAVLDTSGGFGLPREVEATYARYIDTLDAGLRSWALTSAPTGAGP